MPAHFFETSAKEGTGVDEAFDTAAALAMASMASVAPSYVQVVSARLSDCAKIDQCRILVQDVTVPDDIRRERQRQRQREDSSCC